MYKTNEPYTTIMYIKKPILTYQMGVEKREYSKCENSDKINCLFKTFGGTVNIGKEKNVNGIISVEDTAIIETWYRDDITSACRLAFSDAEVYEIIGAPENISMRNKTMKIRLKRIKGGA